MQVQIDFKVTILDGDNKGATYSRSFVEETETKFTDIGLVDEVHVGWRYLHDMPKPVEVEEGKCCSDCVHSGRPAFMYPCNICDEYSMFKKGEKEEKTEEITEKTCETCKFNMFKTEQFSRCNFCNNFSRYEEINND